MGPRLSGRKLARTSKSKSIDPPSARPQPSDSSWVFKGQGKSGTTKRWGKVYIVGAGPGDPMLLTVKGASVIRRADVVLYDRLVSKEIIAKIPKKSKKVCVGTKHGTDPEFKQERINELLLSHVKKGLDVVRLKCGDPFIFGRGGEEVDFLREHGVDYRIIPGLTSAISVPSYAAIPLTHRDLSSSLMIISGHRKNQSENDWNYISKFKGTLIILMGIGTLDETTKQLIDSGMNPDTGVAVIQNGTEKEQKMVWGNLATINTIVNEAGISPPSIIVIGRVINYLSEREALAPAYLNSLVGQMKKGSRVKVI